jgi:hypothetical protein
MIRIVFLVCILSLVSIYLYSCAPILTTPGIINPTLSSSGISQTTYPSISSSSLASNPSEIAQPIGIIPTGGPIQPFNNGNSTVTASKQTYSQGEAITLELTVFDTSNVPLPSMTVTPCPPAVYLFLSSDWILNEPDPNTGLSAGLKIIKTFPAGTGSQTILQGNKAIFQLVWDQKDNNGNQAPPGTYSYFVYTKWSNTGANGHEALCFTIRAS